MFNMVGEWRLSLLRITAVLCYYPRAACEAVVAVTEWSEIFLKTALVCTSGLTLYLSAMLKLNVLFRLMVAGVLYSREELDQHGHFSCPTWSSPQAFRDVCCAALCCGGAGSGKTLLGTIQSVLRVVPALRYRSTSVCVTMLDLLHVALSALSALSRSFRLTVSTIMTLCGCLRPILFTLQTVTGYSSQALNIVWDLSSLRLSPT